MPAGSRHYSGLRPCPFKELLPLPGATEGHVHLTFAFLVPLQEIPAEGAQRSPAPAR